MYSDSPDRIILKEHRVEWYDSPSNDLTTSGNRILTQRVPLRTQHETTLRNEAAAARIKEIKAVDFNLSADDDDGEDNDSLFARSLMKPLSINKTSPDLIWKKQKSEDSNQAKQILSSLPQNISTKECLSLSDTFLSSKPSTSLTRSDILSSSTSMVTPTTNRKRPAQFLNTPNESPLATSTPIAPKNMVVKKPKLSNIISPPKIAILDDSFNDETLDDAVFDDFKIKHPEIAKKAESQAAASQNLLPDVLSTPKLNRSRVKPSTPMYKKSKSMADQRSMSSMLPSIEQQPKIPPKQMLPTKKSNTPMIKAKSFANAADEDDFYNDDIFK